MPKKQTIWSRSYNERTYARLSIVIPKDQRAALEAHAQRRGFSVNGLVNALLREDMGLTEAEWKGARTDEEEP